ncbi:hypothetical protein BD414DRAFT_311669 [Trametes punicea]|nr:hypothetical protein BD414DRAFT_311669 [Trametes punicea]
MTSLLDRSVGKVPSQGLDATTDLLATTMRTPTAGMTTGDLEPVRGKKGGRMRVSKTSKTARNLYAHVYIKKHPMATTHEFDTVFKALDPETMKTYNAMHQFAIGRDASEPLEDLAKAFFALPEDERISYQSTDRKILHGKGKAKARA